MAASKAPDSKKIEVSAPGYQNVQDSFTVEENRGQMRMVRLAPNSAAKVDKVLLAIAVADATSPAKVANAKVTVGPVSGVTDANGLVNVRVLPGVHSFSVTAKGYVKETGRLDVSERKDKQEHMIELRPSGAADIFVRVRRSGSRAPFEKAAVRLSNQIEYTNSKGEARFPNIPFGAHHLMVYADGYKRHEMHLYHNSQSVTGDFTEITLEPEKRP